jgi:hypothetical protein
MVSSSLFIFWVIGNRVSAYSSEMSLSFLPCHTHKKEGSREMEGREASEMEIGIRMQIVGCYQKLVDVDKEKPPNGMNVDEMMLVKLYFSEERCCIYNHFCKADPLTVMTDFDL